MSNELAPVANSSIIVPVSEHATDDVFNSVASSATFLPRVQLIGGNSELAKTGKIGIGRYALIRNKDTADDLSPELVVLPISWRPKAMRTGGEQIVNAYDPKSKIFMDIINESETPDSGCFYGPEFLVWLPKQNVYATFLMASKTSRRQAPELRTLLGKAALLKVQYIKTKKYSWHGPSITPYSGGINTPDQVELMAIAKTFASPPATEVEVADETTARDR